ncbi:serine hydrolase [Lentisalinibacter orientalis]|uniref:serine hydrolase n=1 Tax=Lentisalinibacter orientalis TaxID=2992241 RepID=UPI003865B317
MRPGARNPAAAMAHTAVTASLALVAAVILTFAVPAAARTAAESAASVLERGTRSFEVPGMAVAVVREGEVYAAGEGVTEVGGDEFVDAGTLFRIGSISKAFTAAALAVLVDEGRLGWDDPVIDHLPEFRMHDPWVTREFTIRDLLTHRSGLPLGAGDLLIFPDGNATVAEIVGALRHFEPASSFRSRFDYDNLLYVVAGEVVARVAGRSFQEFLEGRVLAPLGMDDCVAADDRIPAGADTATPHMQMEDGIVTTPIRLTPVVAAAGGIVCSARSMARWLSFVLSGGETPEGKRLVSEAQFRELTGPVTLLGVPSYLAEHAGSYLNAYALGWGVSTFHGEPMLSHGGGVWGMTSFLAILPERDLAVFATGNLMSAAPRAVVYQIIEEQLGDSAPGRDWIEIIEALAGDRRSAAEEAVAIAWEARDADSTPTLPPDRYTGTYRDEWYGDVRIYRAEDGALWFESQRNAPLQGPLEHFQYDTFVARWTDRRLMADAYVTFTIGPEGEVERIRMKAVSPATDFSYDFHDLDLRPVADE